MNSATEQESRRRLRCCESQLLRWPLTRLLIDVDTLYKHTITEQCAWFSVFSPS